MIRNLIREDRIINESINKFLESIILTESTLSQLIGNTPEGEKLVKWLHRVDRLSNFAEYGLLTRKTERVQWKAFKSNPDHYVIIKGPTTAMAIKPNLASFNALRDQAEKDGEVFNPGESNTLVYDFIGFSREGDRIDSKMGDFPEPGEFGIKMIDIKAFDKNPNSVSLEKQEKIKQYRSTVEKLKQELYNKKIPLNKPATNLASTRGGMPFKSDLDRAPHAMFDQIRDFMGGKFDVYIVASKVSEFPQKTQGIKKARKEFALGHKPREIPRGLGIIQGAFDEPVVGRRSPGGIEREKIASRAPLPPNQLDQLVIKIKPILPKFIERANEAVAIQRKAAKSPDEIRRYRDIINGIDDFEIALGTGHKFDIADQNDQVVQVIANAIRQVSGIDNLSSEQGQEYLNNLVAPGEITKLKPILQGIYQQLVNG